MMYLKDFIELAKVYGEDTEVYVGVEQNAMGHFKNTTKEKEYPELCGNTLTSIKNIKTWNGKEGIILYLPLYHR